MNNEKIVFNNMIEFYNSHFYKSANKCKIKSIFEDHWDLFLEIAPSLNIKIRDVVIKEVQKLIFCSTSSLGYSLYQCPECHKLKLSFHTCKSRFCPSCGSMYVKKRISKILSKCYNCKHRHVVFTISDQLRNYFYKDRSRLNLLFEAVNITISSWFRERSKKQNYRPGFILVIHTYGRPLTFNPHIHCILTEGAMGNFNIFKKFCFISYNALRKRFQKVLLDLIEHDLGKDTFRSLKNQIYSHSKDGFYVYAEPKHNHSTKDMVEYAVRYTGKPAMAESRILDYDGKFVTFWYRRHEDNLPVIEKINALEFIRRLIVHIHEENFKTVRYYGIYNKLHKFHDKMILLVKPHFSFIQKQLNTWKMGILKDFGINPLSCPNCGCEMQFSLRVC